MTRKILLTRNRKKSFFVIATFNRQVLKQIQPLPPRLIHVWSTDCVSHNLATPTAPDALSSSRSDSVSDRYVWPLSILVTSVPFSTSSRCLLHVSKFLSALQRFAVVSFLWKFTFQIDKWLCLTFAAYFTTDTNGVRPATAVCNPLDHPPRRQASTPAGTIWLYIELATKVLSFVICTRPTGFGQCIKKEWVAVNSK